jgi:hypothetical protein
MRERRTRADSGLLIVKSDRNSMVGSDYQRRGENRGLVLILSVEELIQGVYTVYMYVS